MNKFIDIADRIEHEIARFCEPHICYKKGSSQPAAPDPVATAKAQGAANKEAAIASQLGSMVNQQTPWGNLTYNQIGTWSDGTPRTEQITTLSPTQQQLFDIGQRTNIALGNLGESQIGRLSNVLNQPLDLSNPAVEQRLYDLATPRLNQRFDRQRDQTLTRLANMGITDPNSDIYKAEMRNLGETENDAYNQILLQGRGQALQELLTQRNQPLNEISALLSGSQIGAPQFQSTPGFNQNPADIMGATYGSYNANAQNAALRQQQQNAMMGGLFGLGGAAASTIPFWSDRRLKTNIRKIGKTKKGFNWYAFDYVWGQPSEGVMADEVRLVKPWAVTEMLGFDRVNYAEVL